MTAGIKAGDLYLPKGEKVLEALQRIDSVDGDDIRFTAEGGGFVRLATRAKFLDHFEFADRETLESLRVFRRELVAIDDEEGTPAWVDGSLWNGWAQPVFEKAAVERLIETQFPDSGERGAVLFADGDAYVLVESACGEAIPAFDRQEVLRLLGDGAQDMTMTDPEDSENEEFEVHLTRIEPFTIKADGQDVQVYAVGDGWTWSVCEPRPAPAP